jgi:hypothetical protein
MIQAVGPIALPDRFAITEQMPTIAASSSNAIPKMSLKINLAAKELFTYLVIVHFISFPSKRKAFFPAPKKP